MFVHITINVPFIGFIVRFVCLSPYFIPYTSYTIYAPFHFTIGAYPVYSGYPKTVVDWEVRKREAVMAVHGEMQGHSELLNQLKEKVWIVCCICEIVYVCI